MSDPTIFNKDANPVTPDSTANPSQNDPNANLLSMIMNEQGQQKYATIQDALKGAAHAQEYIRQLQAQVAEKERLLQASQTEKSKQEELERTVQELLARQNQNPNPNTTDKDALDPTKIAELVAQTLDKRTAAEKAKANQSLVATELVKVFGEDAEKKYNSAAQELGLSVAEMNEFAAKSPKAVLKALGVSEQAAHKPVTSAPVPSAVNTAAFQPSQDTFVRRNETKTQIGATTADLMKEGHNARKLVEELHNAGLEVSDLTDPKVFFKHFG